MFYKTPPSLENIFPVLSSKGSTAAFTSPLLSGLCLLILGRLSIFTSTVASTFPAIPYRLIHSSNEKDFLMKCRTTPRDYLLWKVTNEGTIDCGRNMDIASCSKSAIVAGKLVQNITNIW